MLNVTGEGHMHFSLYFCMDSASGFTKCILPFSDKKCFVSVCKRVPREDALIYLKFLSEASA